MLLLSITAACKPNSLVLLIDEYDHPLIANMDNQRDFAAIRNKLRDFYAQVKARYAAFRFIFITGIARFPHTSIFSEFNTINDISFEEKYCTLLGFTNTELECCFHDQIQNFVRRTVLGTAEVLHKFKEYYDGYHFGCDVKSAVYNPISVMAALKHGTKNQPFAPWWSKTGGFSSLLNNWLYIDRNLINTFLSLQQVSDGNFSTIINLQQLSAVSELGSIDMNVMLYTAGYLTFKQRLDNQNILLSYPNLEIREYLAGLFIHILEDKIKSRSLSQNQGFLERQLLIEDRLLSKNGAAVQKILSSCLALFPYAERKALGTEPGICALISMALKNSAVNAVYTEHQFMGGHTDIEISMLRAQDFPSGVTVVLEVKLEKYQDPAQRQASVDKALNKARQQIISRRYQRVAPPGSAALCYAVCVDFKQRDVAGVEYVNTDPTPLAPDSELS